MPDPSVSGQDGSESGSTVVRVPVQPLVAGVWIGGAVMAIGTVLSSVPGAGSPTGRAKGREQEGVA